MSAISVAVIHGQALFLRGIRSILKEDSSLTVVAEGTSISDALRIATHSRPDIILMCDLIASNRSSPNPISSVSGPSKVLLMTATAEIEDLVFKLNAGAVGCVLHEAAEMELVRAIHAVTRGEIYLSSRLATRFIREAAGITLVRDKSESMLGDLSYRESEVLRYVGQGLTNKEIGRKLFLSEKTVKYYMTCILSKTKTRNRVQAALMAKS
jgi:DNA-binding NarL/FixJ family response regulator